MTTGSFAAELRPDALLSVRDVRKYFDGHQGIGRRKERIYAVDGVSFDVRERETLGLVGESGCGKSTLARVVTGLYAPTSGTVLLHGSDINARGRRNRIDGQMQMVFQEPGGSLNPRRKIMDSVTEPLLSRMTSKERERRALEMLERVGLRAELGNRYPHQLSGGQQQRACIARALISNPALVVLDEALSSLDVSLQAQIVELLRDLQHEFQSAYVFITHDLATAVELSTQIAIMYLGALVEFVPVSRFQEGTLHPYSQALVDAILAPEPSRRGERKALRLEGDIPSAAEPPSGCRFNTRCPYARERCQHERPPLQEHRPEHWAACHFVGDLTTTSELAAT